MARWLVQCRFEMFMPFGGFYIDSRLSEGDQKTAVDQTGRPEGREVRGGARAKQKKGARATWPDKQ